MKKQNCYLSSAEQPRCDLRQRLTEDWAGFARLGQTPGEEFLHTT